MRSTSLQRPSINTSLTLLASLALLLLPLALGMKTPARAGTVHDHHAQHTTNHSAPSPSSCEHFHICCACLALAPTSVLVLSLVALVHVHIHFQSIPQVIPTPPPRT